MSKVSSLVWIWSGLMLAAGAEAGPHVTSATVDPVAVDDVGSTNEDTQLVVSAPGVLGNDTDGDSDPLTAVEVSGPTHGSLQLNPDGSYTYTPDADYSGSDSFTYQADDGNATSNTATVSLTIDPVNDAPVAVNDSYSTNEDSDKIVADPGVLGNDTDTENDSLTAVVVSNPTHGDVTLNPDGSFTYTPDANYSGSDSFTYKADDGTDQGNTATVSLTIDPVNDAPVAVNDSYSTNEDTDKIVADPGVLGNDTDTENDSLTAVVVSNPTHGDVTLNPDGSFTYTPDANYSGSDSFTYKADDGTDQGNTATVSLTIDPVNDAPVAVNDSYSTNSVALPVSTPGVLGNDTDAENDTLTAVVVSNPTHGDVTLDPDGSFTYTPDANYSGGDSFTYKADDGTDQGNVATVSITVTANPTISNVSPGSGTSAGGTQVTISGTLFTGLSSVTFGGAAASQVSNNSTQIVVNTPPHALGGVDVVVTTSAGSGTATQAYTYADATAPVLNCPNSVTAYCAPSAGKNVTFTVTAVDDADPNPAIECTPPSGSLFAIGTTSVTCTATDSSNNSSQCTFSVIVKAPGKTKLLRRDGIGTFDRFGSAVAFIGDVNLDGVSDYAVGGPLSDPGATDGGSLLVYSAKTGSTLYVITGSSNSESLGASVSALADVTNDGRADFLYGSPGRSADRGRVTLMSGTAVSAIYTLDGDVSGDRFGGSLDVVGDVNNDTVPDFIVGAAGSASTNGFARMFSGATGAVLWTVAGDAAGDGCGSSVAGIGDVNSDGKPDVAIGCPQMTAASASGRVKICSGVDGALLRTFNGASGGDWCGFAVGGGRDVNGDGTSDYVVGSPRPGSGLAGRAHVLSGLDGSTLYALTGASVGDSFGGAVELADLNGDSRADILIGAQLDDGGTADQGSVTVYSGSNGSVLETIRGDSLGDRFGSSIAALNLDGDACYELLIGALNSDMSGAARGSAYLISCKDVAPTSANYGTGWPGTNGVPSFTMTGSSQLCGAITLVIANSRNATSPAALFLGLQKATIATAFGGQLLVASVTGLGLSVPAAGLLFPATLPCDTALLGLDIYMQVLEGDPGASAGLSFSRGLQMTLGGQPMN